MPVALVAALAVSVAGGVMYSQGVTGGIERVGGVVETPAPTAPTAGGGAPPTAPAGPLAEIQLQTCGPERLTIETAIEVYTLSVGSPPPSGEDLVPGFLAEFPAERWVLVGGEVEPVAGGDCDG